MHIVTIADLKRFICDLPDEMRIETYDGYESWDDLDVWIRDEDNDRDRTPLVGAERILTFSAGR